MKGAEKLNIRDTEGGAVVAVKAVPGASRERIAGVLGDCLKITTAASAEKGKANKAIAAVLAEALGVGRPDVQLLSGHASPRKQFKITGVAAGQVRSRLLAFHRC